MRRARGKLPAALLIHSPKYERLQAFEELKIGFQQRFRDGRAAYFLRVTQRQCASQAAPPAMLQEFARKRD